MEPWWLVAGGGWRVAGGGWRVAGGGWRVAGGWWLVAGGGWWWLVTGGWWWLVTGGWWLVRGGGWWVPLMLVLNHASVAQGLETLEGLVVELGAHAVLDQLFDAPLHLLHRCIDRIMIDWVKIDGDDDERISAGADQSSRGKPHTRHTTYDDIRRHTTTHDTRRHTTTHDDTRRHDTRHTRNTQQWRVPLSTRSTSRRASMSCTRASGAVK
jgi:hypothetical protein